MAKRRKTSWKRKFAKAAKACKGKSKAGFQACMRKKLRK